ncbi:MAG: glucose-6-phosphate dehydrogenase, partial [Sphaerospermopsis sp. SIO1G2]|nr:glucose-6-phosphate dehydrogenase [Sphaerospermopsis sp. SIO1G2]
MSGDDIRDEKVKVLKSLRPPLHNGEADSHVIRAQYQGYLDEKGVPEGSQTETFIACRTYIDNWRWGGVPILLRTGKGLPSRFTSINVQFHMPPHSLFGNWAECHLRPNALTLRVQPHEGIDLHIEVKEPGPGQNMCPVKMTFNYDEFFHRPSPEAYQRLLRDVITGDQSLFIRSDEVEACWRWADSLRQMLQDQPMYDYPVGTAGPKEADCLFGPCEGRWATE